MKTGMTRPIDSLGRIVIPKELRDAFDLPQGQYMEIHTLDNGDVVLRKVHAKCVICGSTEDLHEIQQVKLCEQCANLIAYCCPVQGGSQHE